MKENNQTYNKILHEAAKLFDQKGYAKTTTREIAEAAGINRGHLHYYFARKEDILGYHFQIYEKKVKYFFKESGVQIHDYRVYVGLFFACYIHTLQGDDFSHDLLLLGRYDLDAYFYLITDSVCTLALQFAGQQGQTTEMPKLKDCIEITLKIAIRLLYVKLTYDKERTNADIWTISLRHGYYQLGLSGSEIEALLRETKSIFDAFSMEKFEKIASRRDYDVLEEELKEL